MVRIIIMKLKLKIFSLCLFIMTVFMSVELYKFRLVIDNHVDYILVHELDNNIIYNNKPQLEEDNFKEQVTRKIEKFFEDSQFQLEKITYQIDELIVVVAVYYSCYNIPNILVKEVGVYEKP